jgi:hypothetical protein
MRLDKKIAKLVEWERVVFHYWIDSISPRSQSAAGTSSGNCCWQAGRVSRQLTFREISLHPLAILFVLFVYVHVAVRGSSRMNVGRLAATVA